MVDLQEVPSRHLPLLPKSAVRAAQVLSGKREHEREKRERERASELGRFSWAAPVHSVRMDSPASSTLEDPSHVLETFIYSVFL